jgi:hypothetical protein
MHCRYGAILTHRYALLGYTHARMAHVRYSWGYTHARMAHVRYSWGYTHARMAHVRYAWGYTHARMAHVRYAWGYPPGRHACTIAPFGFLYGAFGSKLAGALGEGLGFLYVHHAMSPFSLASTSFRYMCSLRFGGGVEVVDLKVKPAQPGRIAHRA